jgi:predicted transcriptional regulator
MPEDIRPNRSELLGLTSDIVSAHLSNNGVASAVVASLIQAVFDS